MRARVMQLHSPSVPALAIHEPSGENFTELTLAMCPRYFFMHSLFFVSHNLRAEGEIESVKISNRG
jgi:hypothetical protein